MNVAMGVSDRPRGRQSARQEDPSGAGMNGASISKPIEITNNSR